MKNYPVLYSKLCVCVSVRAGECASYLRLEFNSENVLPSRGALRLQSQRSELGVDEEQPEDTNTQ